MPKISELPAGAAPDGTEVIPAVQGAATVGLTATQVARSAGSALTKVDDTNVTLTLGGTPATAVLRSTSITAGWTGRLALSRLATGTSGYALIGNGASDPSYQGFVPSGTGAVTRTWNAKARDCVSVKDFGATGDGTTDDVAAINAAILAAYTAGIGNVYVPAGSYRVAANPVYMKPYVRLIGEGAVSLIKQGNSANLDAVIDFSGYLGGGLAATGGSLDSITVDGNRDNNSGAIFLNTDKRVVYFGNTNYVTINNCIIQNGPGYGVAGSSQTGMRFTNNRVSNTENYSLLMVDIGGGCDSYAICTDNLFDNQVLFEGMNYVTCCNNQIHGYLVGGRADPMHVNISGTAVTWVSGPTFSAVKSGAVLIAKLGTIQVPVKTVNSSTSITLQSTGGTETNVLAIFGNNDLLGYNGKRGILSGNTITAGASYGISLGGYPDVLKECLFSNNNVSGQGKAGIVYLGGAGGGGGIGGKNNSFVGNMVVNVCQGDGASCQPTDFDRHSFIIQAEGQTTENFLLEANFCVDDYAMTYTWLNIYGTTESEVVIAPTNVQVGAQNEGYFGFSALQPYQWNIPVPTGDYEKINGPSCNVTRGFSGSVAYWQCNDGYMEFGTSGNFDLSFRTNAIVRAKISGGGDFTVRSDIATPAAGSTSARLLFGTTAGFGIYYGSNAPTVSAAQGSIYLRSDGSSTSTRMYVNTNGSTTWTSVTTAA